MKRCLLVVASLMCLQSCAARPRGGEWIIEEINRRYTGKRFTHVTFVQSTRSADGGLELWYEAIRPEGLVRVDIAPLDQRRGFMYRADSMYVFEGGQLARAKGDERWITMLLLVDIYALSAERSLARLRELGVDVSRSHSTHWNGRPATVVGATSGDTVSAQAWFDEEHLYTVRVIQPAGQGHPRVEFRIAGHQFIAGGWIESEIQILVGGNIVTKECYADIRPNANLADALFDPAAFGVRRWAEDAYPNVTRGPECAAWRS